jgi:DNA-directed RNA polymerase specialized sigma24 family protein
MTSAGFEEALPIARQMARQKALSAIGRCGLTFDDREDIASQLVITFCFRFRRFDSGRASVRTFASRVMDKEIASILRSRMALSRRHFENEIGPEEASAQPGSTSEHAVAPAVRQEFWMDVERALAKCSPVLLDTARALSSYTPSELSRIPGQSRTVVYRRMRRLRAALTAAGIGPAYFSHNFLAHSRSCASGGRDV